MIYSNITYLNTKGHFLKIIGIVFGFLSVFIGTSAAQTPLQRMIVTQMESNVPSVTLDYPGQAIVVIESTMGNLRFGSNMNGIVAQSRPTPGEYVLFVEPQNQILTIDAPGFIQQRYPLRGLSARQVVNLRVEPEQQTSELISVIFNVEPGDALLYVDGEQTVINQTVRLPDGDVTLRLEREGYRTIEEDITISAENIQFTYRLEEVEDVPVLFYTNTGGATISIDGVERGQTDQAGNLGIFLFPGNYIAEVRRSGYLTIVDERTVTESSDNRFDFELQRNIARLLLTLEPADAIVSINRQVYGSQTEFDLAPGRYRLEVERVGHDPFTETFDLTLNEELQKQVSLQAHTGRLRVEVSPLSAQVELRNSDGEMVRRWQGLQVIRDLPVGEYQLLAEAEGHSGYRDIIEITRNQTLEKGLILEPLQTAERVPASPVVQQATRTDQERDDLSRELTASSLPSRGTAITASLLMPGAGHIYSGNSRGYLYLIGGLAAGGYVVYTLVEERSIESDYRAAMEDYNTVLTQESADRYMMQALRHYDEWIGVIDQRNMALAVFAGIYALQLADILITTRERGYRNQPQRGWQAHAAGTGFRLRYGFN